MKTRITLLLAISADEAVERIRSLPEIKNKTYLMERTKRGVLIWRRRNEPTFEEYELTRIELRVTVSKERKGTKVVATTVQRPRLKGIASATAGALAHAGGNFLFDLFNARDSLARWRNEKSELLNLVSRALMPVSVRDDETGPYRE
ncbi:MAG: hypothetical protein JKY37_03895 [Nannocystaceae bacterium]|nr:hypothetical protein [Nannocystaceae bacterium]